MTDSSGHEAKRQKTMSLKLDFPFKGFNDMKFKCATWSA